ncbi:U3 small nucleolar RNA-associated protein 10 [Sporothrix brasiliensis 5110]|uniref:U3 small nucleolar RNA-associated protein 10 n=1 Tax=Sporothrix brasiliensis 5110 TaxID=1398154 RepID=A0A0C2FPI0_9PEZI|nr:U3 small nucleolar RNA-associated protein 10 [Sporothrix brasiliensis 5110]KIH92973.1 U3 small nucleolar RNA-associated protein 10 [Sporothrix brasiliensis 5110]
MASSLAAQLAQIAAKSKISLDVKAQKAAHSKSLLFEPRVAASQSFQSVYVICRDGFDELCQLDERFVPFGNTLFSELSQDEDRTMMDEAENKELDRKIESFLRLSGSRLRLLPAIKSIEWLIRRFRIHEFNTSTLITTFLPYHSIPAFVTLMSILPTNLPYEYRFLSPYIRSLTALPRAAIVQHATHRFDFLTTLSSYTLAACHAQQHYPGLITFWGGVMTESINGMLDTLRSGRRSVQADNDQSVLQKVGPVLGDALMIREAPGVQIAAYMAVSVFVSKAQVADLAITAFMEQVVMGWTSETAKPGLVCLSILAQQRSAKQLSRKVAKAVLKVQNLPHLLVEIGKQRRIDKLANGLVLALTDRLAKKAAVRGLPIIKSIILGGILQDKQLVVAFKSLLLAAHDITDETDPDGSVRKELGATLIVLSQAPENAGGLVIRKVIEEVDFDIEELELKLDATIRPKLLLDSTATNDTDTAMADGAEETRTSITKEDLDATLGRLSTLTRPSSCLAQDPNGVFEQFCQLFLATASYDKAELEKLDAAPLLGRADAVSDHFYFTFLIRIWSGPYPTLARVAALDMAAARLRLDDCFGVDFQAVLPYIIAALSDPAKKVRRAAAGFLAEVKRVSPLKETKSTTGKNRWGATELYAEQADLSWLTFDARASLLDVLLGSAEEAILHEDHVPAVLADVLDKSSKADVSGSGGEQVRLSHGLRLSILQFLAGHAVLTPVINIKIRLLKALNEVRGVSGTTRTQVLLPLLNSWAALSAEEASALVAKEALDESVVDSRSVDVVIPNDTSALETLFSIIQNTKGHTRPNLISCVFKRIRKMWPVMKEDFRNVIAQFMLEQVQKPPAAGTSSDDLDIAAEEATDLLFNVELSTQILTSFLETLQQSAKMATDAPPNKRRRTSSSEHNRGQRIQANSDLRLLVNRATFILQLVQASKPAEHPELLPGLFVVLSDLQILRSYVGSELGYLQNVVLSCLLAMMPVYQSHKNLKIDTTVGHGDVLVNCIHKSSSPAVQNTALLLVASLAKTAPDVVLHSVMPIFTLMGTSVLRQSDDYSAHVVNQTIKEVIPPLIDTFKKGKRNIVVSASDLLSSFVIAYEHIPSHRKHDLFTSLIENLGPNDFLFAILAMFADRYGTADSTCAFLTELIGSFPVEIQLQSLTKFVSLVGDIFKPKPSLSATLLGKREDDGQVDLQKSAVKELTLLPQLLSNRRLKDGISRLEEADDDMESAKIRELYIQLLEDILTLADTVKTHGSAGKKQALHNRCGDALAQLLNLQSIGEFIKAVEVLLDRPNMSVRQKVLRALEVRVDEERVASVQSRVALLAFLPQLTAVIRDSSDIAYKHTAITCVDKIAEKYGSRDLEAVTAAAAAIAGDACLGQADPRLRVMALLCLASLVDVLHDAIVPILPTAIPRALSYLKESLEGRATDPENIALHNAAYALMMALAQHLPFMITSANLDKLVVTSFASAEAGLEDDEDNEANTTRLTCLLLLAKQVEPKTMLDVLRRNWPIAVRAGQSATLEFVQVLTAVIDKHGKSSIVKNLPVLSVILQNAFDLRRESRVSGQILAAAPAKATGKTAKSGQANEKRLVEIEAAVNTAALHMVFKLNDSAFRPVFEDLMQWCDHGLPQLDVLGRCLRQQSVYGFLFLFFDRLKSAVTSYAAYVVDGAAAALRAARIGTSLEDRALWSRILQTLTAAFKYDEGNSDNSNADGTANGHGSGGGFWQVPTHFSAVAPALVEQFAKAKDLHNNGAPGLTVEYLVPAVVELAKAAHAADHQKELNSLLLKRLQHSTNTAERLALVQCQQVLAEEVGEEWLAMLPEMLPLISELQEDSDEAIDRETTKWIHKIEEVLGESLDAMLQ